MKKTIIIVIIAILAVMAVFYFGGFRDKIYNSPDNSKETSEKVNEIPSVTHEDCLQNCYVQFGPPSDIYDEPTEGVVLPPSVECVLQCDNKLQ